MSEDHDNLRAALQFAIDRACRTGRLEDADAGLRLANAMVWFWQYNLRYEGVDAFRQAIALDEQEGSLHGLAFTLVHLAHTLIGDGDPTETRELLARGDDIARRVQNPRCQAWAAWGRARLALADGRDDSALQESLRATDLLQNREFPWAMSRLWELVAEAAAAAGRPDIEARARSQAGHLVVTRS